MSFRALATPAEAISASQSCLNSASDLIYRMLNTNPTERPNSQEVCNELDKQMAIYNRDRIPEDELVRYLREQPQPAGYKEVGWQDDYGVVAFREMYAIFERFFFLHFPCILSCRY